MRYMMFCAALLVALSARCATPQAPEPPAGSFSAEDGLQRARKLALAPRSDRARPCAVAWTQGNALSPENVFAADGRCATLQRSADDAEAPAFALDFGKASTEGWAVVRVKSAEGNPTLRLAYANYPDREALREDGDFNEDTRARYMGRDVELPVLPANVNRHELYRIPGAGVYVAPMLMPQFRYMRVQLDTPGKVEIDAIEVVRRDVCDTSLLDGYFDSSDQDVNRLWQIGVWTAQLATIKTTWAMNVVEGWLRPRKLTKGADVHLSVAKDAMPAEGSLSVKVSCGVNPAMSAHAGVALFAADSDNAFLCEISECGIVRWVRRNGGVDNVLAEKRFDAPLADGRVHVLEIDWRKREEAVRLSISLDGGQTSVFDYFHCPHGSRFGFWSLKGWWPSYDDLTVRDGSGAVVFSDGFDDPALPKWEFERPEPFVSDGAKRDRLIWSGDLYWAGRNFYYAFNDCSLMRKTIGLLARNQTPEGYIHACPYAEQPTPKDGDYGPFESDEFAAWFIPVLHDYWRHTGDDGVVREFYPNVRRLLGYLGRFTREDGLFEQRFVTSKHAFSSWLQKGDVRHRSYMDILLWMCWRDGAEMARATGEAGDAEKWEAQAEKVRKAANRAYWDERHGVFRDALEDYYLEWDGEPSGAVGRMVRRKGPTEGAVAMEPNALAVESGFATPEQARRICPQLAAQSGVRKFILLSAIAKGRSGFGDDAWQILSTNRWGVFASPAWDGPWATAEGMDPPHYGPCDQSHPDTAPAGFISSCYLGVVPLAPGFARFSFSPKPTKKMTFAEGRVPTRFGPIDARWERTADGGFAFELVVPEGTRAEVSPPEGKIVEVDGAPGDGKNLTPGRHRLLSRPLPDVICLPVERASRTSLAGTWKFKGLDRQAAPFGPTTDAERHLLSPETDDSGWAEIAVPFNWWSDGRFDYAKVFNPEEVYFRGYYRRHLDIPAPSDGKRRFLRFEEIGAEAEIFVNGTLAGRHLGDFIPCEVEITHFLKPGDNLIAVRVLADFGPAPKNGVTAFTRPYGAHWNHTCIKGGLWHDVFLVEEPAVRISEVRIDPAEDLRSVRIRGTIDNAGPSGTFALAATLMEDTPEIRKGVSTKCPQSGCAVGVSLPETVALSSGTNAFDITVAAPAAKPWSPDAPNLYWAVLTLADAKEKTVSSRLERFGFRTMRIRGDRFYLNGKPFFPVGDSLHSLHYGGSGTEEAVARLRRDLLAHKANGANTLRTAHMPAIPEVYDFADEIGLAIYDEWANCFCNHIDEEAFERSNLPALEAWIRRDYNHPCVILWSLGNEVKHQEPEVARQLDKQYDIAKALDGQGRPICSFSGVADTWNYGSDRVKTDFLDTHDYLGIDGNCWPTWFRSMDGHYVSMAKVFGEGGELKMPLIMWECVGGGWDIRNDDGMKPGDRARYLDWMHKWSHWGAPPGIPFSASAGLLPILDPSRGRHYVQSYLATRLCELFRQDRRLAGFAPWFADASVPGATRWTQQAYPLLRNTAATDGHLMFRQLLSPGAKDVECVVVNDTDGPLDGAHMAISLWANGRETPIGECVFDHVADFGEGICPLRLAIPAGFSGDGEVRLRLTRSDGRVSINSYAVRLHPDDEAMASVVGAHPVSLAATDARLDVILDRLAIPRSGESWPVGGTVVVPSGAAYDGDAARAFVDGGGTLLLLEPTGSFLSGFPPLYLSDGTNHLAEIVVPGHPVFAGLDQADFDIWAENPFGIPVPQMVCPLGDGVLVCRPRYICGQNQHGMALCEYAVGKGRLLVSTLDATRLWGENAAATRYLRNLLAYVAGGSPAPAPDLLPSACRGPDASPAVQTASFLPAPLHLSFPACAKDQSDIPNHVVSFAEQLPDIAAKDCKFLTIVFRSDSPDGVIDITIPAKDGIKRLTYSLQTAFSHGETVTVRLNLARDFHAAQRDTFGLADAKGEITFWNGFEKEWVPAFPRPAVAADILELRFE